MSTLTLQNWQWKASWGEISGRRPLPVFEAVIQACRTTVTEAGRLILNLIKTMKAIVYSVSSDPGSQRVHPNVMFYNDNGTVVEDAQGSIDFPLSLIDDQTSFISGLESKIDDYATLNSYTVEKPYVWGVPKVNRIFANPSRSLNSAFQISTFQDAQVKYSVDIACASTALTGQKGKVTLQYADDSGMSTNLVSVVETENGTGILLGLANNNVSVLSGIIPAGKYAKLVTTNVTSTPTFTLRRSQEVLI